MSKVTDISIFDIVNQQALFDADLTRQQAMEMAKYFGSDSIHVCPDSESNRMLVMCDITLRTNGGRVMFAVPKVIGFLDEEQS